MRRILGCVTPSPVQGYLHITLRQSVPLRSTNRQASAAKRWMCLRCYHRSSEHAWGSGRGIPSAPCLIDRAGLFREGRGSRTAFPKTPARALSTQTNNAADKPRKDLPSQEEGRRSHISKRFTKVMDHLQSNIFFAGQRLNDLTGYSGIEALKKDIEQQGQSSTPPQLRRR